MDKRGNIVKRSFYSPIILGSIPIRQKKRETIKKKGKRSTIEKYAKSKTWFHLESECENLNYWNVRRMEKENKLEQILECKEKVKGLQE